MDMSNSDALLSSYRVNPYRMSKGDRAAGWGISEYWAQSLINGNPVDIVGPSGTSPVNLYE